MFVELAQFSAYERFIRSPNVGVRMFAVYAVRMFVRAAMRSRMNLHCDFPCRIINRPVNLRNPVAVFRLCFQHCKRPVCLWNGRLRTIFPIVCNNDCTVIIIPNPAVFINRCPYPHRRFTSETVYCRALALTLQAGLRSKVFFCALPFTQLHCSLMRILTGGFQRLEFPLPAPDLPLNVALFLRGLIDAHFLAITSHSLFHHLTKTFVRVRAGVSLEIGKSGMPTVPPSRPFQSPLP